MQRVCFTLTVDPGQVAEYRRRHEQVWPEMQDALREAGWSNYSIFVNDAGLVVGYVETDNFDAALARMAVTDVNRRWQQQMALLFTGIGGRNADEAMNVIPEAFHLD